jgi:hypothetical protein
MTRTQKTKKKEMRLIEVTSSSDFLKKVRYLRRNTLYIIREKRDFSYIYDRSQLIAEMKALDYILNIQRHLGIRSQPAIIFEKK